MAYPPGVEVVRPRPHVAVVECTGEHDLATRDQTAKLLADLVAENDLVVVDVSHADFVDSSFLHNLVKAHRLSRARGSQLRVQCGPAAVVKSVLEISGLSQQLGYSSTRAGAVAEPRANAEGDLR